MKLKSLLILILIAFSIAAVSAVAETTGKKYVGYRHKGVVFGEKLPNDVKDLGGGLLSDENYGVTRFVKGKKYMLWLEKIIDRDAEGVPNWEVKDLLVFSKLKKTQRFLFSYSSPCTENDRENLDLIVMAEVTPRRKTYKILRAWRANIELERFEVVPAEAISCQYTN